MSAFVSILNVFMINGPSQRALQLDIEPLKYASSLLPLTYLFVDSFVLFTNKFLWPTNSGRSRTDAAGWLVGWQTGWPNCRLGNFRNPRDGQTSQCHDQAEPNTQPNSVCLLYFLQPSASPSVSGMRTLTSAWWML